MIEFLSNITNIIILISALLNLILLIGVRNLLKQTEQLEDRLISSINEVRGRIENTLKKMKDIDNREAFEKDDEVGVTFQELKKLIEDLNNEI
jgi:predicted PurR-regulated permease PerM|tara:strand:- start:1027 stop:1305 length:279 start_codon:yes stop_codon:yes gene_type:complete